MGISTPSPRRMASGRRCSCGIPMLRAKDKEMDRLRVNASAHSNADLIAIPIKTQEENHG